MKKLSLIGAAILALAAGQALAASKHGHKRDRNPQIVAGKISIYGPPYEGAGTTADGSSSAQPGIAMREGPYGRFYCVTLNRGKLHAILEHIDWGPASWTGRSIDITGAGVARFRGHGRIYTDAPAHARLLPRRHGPAWRCGER